MRRRWRCALVVLALVWPMAAPAAAGELAAFLETAGRAMRAAVAASHYLRTENPGPAVLALVRAERAWEALRERFGTRLPDAFDGNPAFPAVLDEVARRLAEARARLGEGATAEARAAVEEAIQRYRTARRASHIVLYPDCIEEMNAAMARLWRWRRREDLDLADRAMANAIKAEAAITRYLYERCYRTAPRALRGEEFERLFQGAIRSLGLIPEAVDGGQKLRFINILRELISFDRILRFRYG